mmetsp:Transcript_1193/g.3102  ORF Transcript_1193/g.3102 Transcript_1193/m.3102 type:complete len:91 (+) Transcript_1193:426-698(+)
MERLRVCPEERVVKVREGGRLESEVGACLHGQPGRETPASIRRHQWEESRDSEGLCLPSCMQGRVLLTQTQDTGKGYTALILIDVRSARE